MNDQEFIDKLARLEELSDEERRGVRQYVRDHPEYRDELQSAERWALLIRAARSLGERPVPDEVLSYLAVMERLEQEPSHPSVRDRFRDVRRYVERHPSHRQRYQAIAERMEQLEEGSNAGDQFERLTGYTLDDGSNLSAPKSANSADESPAGEQRADKEVPLSSAVGGSKRQPQRSTAAGTAREPEDREPARHQHHMVWYVKRGAGALAFLVLVYAALFTLSVSLQPEHQRLVMLDGDELRVEGYGVATRGVPADEDLDVQQAYLRGLTHLDEASTSFIGLFPRFDDGRLQLAAQDFSEVLDRTDEGAFLHVEAAFWLGQAHLAQGNIDEAKAALQTVVEGDGRLSTEAAGQLAALQDPADNAP